MFQGCLEKLRNWFAGNYVSTGAGVVTMFIIQVGNTQKMRSAEDTVFDVLTP